MSALARTYHGAFAAAGPLLYVAGTKRAALGEWVTIAAPGQAERRGQIIDVGEQVTVIQVFEETLGLPPARCKIELTGEAASAVVGEELIGRALSGAGRPRDGLPDPVGSARQPFWGAPINPCRRRSPSDFIESGISAIDGMNTLVRGQKLPVFSGAGLPALDLAATIVENARARGGEPFTVIFAAIGITARDSEVFLDRFRESGAFAHSVLYLNQAGDPTIERLLAPRLALTQAEYLAFHKGHHVLVVMADITYYCEALREVASAREEVPARRGYPGYMYTDLATLFERAGLIDGSPGSITQIPILTMPDDDITHPIPDLTGYITEGQIVLSRELHRQAIFPPIDVLPSLSRLMNSGIGADRTVGEHRRWADQLYSIYARARQARLMASIVGEAGLTESDRRAVEFGDRFEREFVHQGDHRRTLEETIETGWRLLDSLPVEDLSRLREDDHRLRKERRPSLEPGEAGTPGASQ